MRILITGGTGFIARHLAEDLAREHSLLLIGQSKGISKLLITDKITVPYAITDYSNESLSKLLKDFNPDTVIHLAAQRPDEKLDLIPDYLRNLIISANLFSACETLDIKNLVNISSISLYSREMPIPWREDIPCIPKNKYGLSKQWVEQLAGHYSQRGLYIKTLRLGQVFGCWERPELVIQIFIENAIEGKPLKIFGANEGRRHYIYVKDVVGAIKQSIKHTTTADTFNIGMKGNHSFLEIAKTINMVFKNQAGVIHLPEIAADSSISLMNIDKASKLLGWEPQYTLRSGFEEMFHLILKEQS